MTQLKDLACRLLRVEQQLIAYQKLHTDELAELWQTLNECKQAIAAILSDSGTEPYAGEQAYDPPRQDPQPSGQEVSGAGQEQTEESREAV